MALILVLTDTDEIYDKIEVDASSVGETIQDIYHRLYIEGSEPKISYSIEVKHTY